MDAFLDILAGFFATALVAFVAAVLLLVCSAQASRRKSYALLYQWLTPHQRWQMKTKGWFAVKGKSDCTYIISRYAPYNIRIKLPNGRHAGYMCIAPVGVPDGDKLLAQKILLETDELRAMEIANFMDIPWDM